MSAEKWNLETLWKTYLENTLTGFSKHYNNNRTCPDPNIALALKMLNFVSGSTVRQVTEPNMEIKRDLNFVGSKV